MLLQMEQRRSFGLELAHGVGERVGIGGAGTQDVEGEALRALGADAGKLAQLLDEARHGLCKAGHGGGARSRAD